MLETEMRNKDTKNIDKVSTYEMLTMMNRENRNAIEAVEAALPDISIAVDKIAACIESGGRLIYVGAGTSGRLGVLDAAECPPTFGVDENTVLGLIAGGETAMTHASEGAEDNAAAGAADIRKVQVNEKDAVVGISAAGNAAYVVEALKEAKHCGACTIAVTCNNNCTLADLADILVVSKTGPEVITGSTRLKAGTAHKLILNMFSTGAMIKTGKVYENFMINVKPVNKKLRQRCIWIISQITGAGEQAARQALDSADGNIKNAIEIINGAK